MAPTPPATNREVNWEADPARQIKRGKRMKVLRQNLFAPGSHPVATGSNFLAFVEGFLDRHLVPIRPFGLRPDSADGAVAPPLNPAVRQPLSQWSTFL